MDSREFPRSLIGRFLVENNPSGCNRALNVARKVFERRWLRVRFGRARGSFDASASASASANASVRAYDRLRKSTSVDELTARAGARFTATRRLPKSPPVQSYTRLRPDLSISKDFGSLQKRVCSPCSRHCSKLPRARYDSRSSLEIKVRTSYPGLPFRPSRTSTIVREDGSRPIR